MVISEYMRPIPYTIGSDIAVREAVQKMHKNNIRHLPVLHGGKLVGIVSERDLNLVRSTPGGEEYKIQDVMSEPAYSVSTDTPLSEAVGVMMQRKLGAVVVQEPNNGKVVGIFTAIDGLQILHEALRFGRIP